MAQASAGIILAGGHSRRMGTDKALLEIDGETLLGRTVRVVSAVVREVLIVGRTELPPGLGEVAAMEDAYPGIGPLGGIAFGLEQMEAEQALVVACDLPFLRTEVLQMLLDLAPGYDAVVPRVGARERVNEGQARRPTRTEQLHEEEFPSPALRGRGCAGWGQPTCAVYARSSLPVIRRHLGIGRYRLHDLLSELRVRWVEEEEIRRVDPQLHSFMNANTASEWDEILRTFSSRPDDPG
jgi:molybdopterin-guanine dinucleotide biosynthesis protein A